MSGPVILGVTRTDRRTGLSPVIGPHALLLRTRSVFGIDAPDLLWVALDRSGVVVRTGRLNWLVICLSASWILELPPDSDLPAIGTRLEVYRSSGPRR